MNSSVFSFTAPPLDNPEQKGLRVAVQPGMACRGWPATAGSKALENYTALEDATVIRLLKKAGAAIVGITRMSEFGLGLANDTCSQAVSKNLAETALIADNLGEARMAAALAGLAGFKPSYGIVSRLGLIGLMPSMECWGMLARTASDIRRVMAAICAADDKDFSMHDKSRLPDFSINLSGSAPAKVIGVAKGYEQHLTRAETAAWQNALSALERAGFTIKPVFLPDPALFSSVHHLIGSVEASSSAGKYDGVRYGHRTDTAENWNEMYLKTRGEAFGTLIKSYLFQGACFQFQHTDALETACRIRGYLLDETLAALDATDALALLTVRDHADAYTAATIQETYQAFSFTLQASVTGLPAIQLPGHALYQDRDFGLQLIGKPLHDPQLLGLARNLGHLTQGEPAA